MVTNLTESFSNLKKNSPQGKLFLPGLKQEISTQIFQSFLIFDILCFERFFPNRYFYDLLEKITKYFDRKDYLRLLR